MLSEIVDHIALDKPSVSRKWIESVINEVEKLASFPKAGRIVPELKTDQYRELIMGNYRIVYKLKKSEIHVLTIRNFKQILSLINM